MSSLPPFDTVDTAIQAIAAGGLVIVTDDEGRENEGDLVLAAEKATPELVNMMTAQRTYQANAQTIKTQDQVLSTLTNLR